MEPKTLIAILAGGVTVVAAIAESYSIHEREKQKRAEIKSNRALDILAIQKAQALLIEKIQRGDICDIAQLTEAMANEIAFQKIAVRENP